MDKRTDSPESAYASQPNILVPKVHPGGVASAQARAKSNFEGKLSGKFAGKTLNAAPTLDQEQ